MKPEEVIPAFATETSAELEALGWAATIDGQEYSLHRRYRDGTPMKTNAVAIAFHPMTYDCLVDQDGVVHKMNWRERPKPWVVSGTKWTTRSFGDATRAKSVFLELAKERAPKHSI